MRYRTAAILSVVLIGGMFVLPVAAKAVLSGYVEHGLVIPLYLRIFFGFAAFCLSFSWLLALPIVGVLFTLAALTHARAPVRR